jgi:hypothetical protein
LALEVESNPAIALIVSLKVSCYAVCSIKLSIAKKLPVVKLLLILYTKNQKFAFIEIGDEFTINSLPDINFSEEPDLLAFRLRVIEFDQTASVQIDHRSPPRASDTMALRDLPGGFSPQIALARLTKSGGGAPAGTSLATTLSWSVICTFSPEATHFKMSAHCSGTCWTLAVFTPSR